MHIILAGVFVLVLVALVASAWLLVYRVRHGEMPWAPMARRLNPPPVMHELPGPERRAIPQHVNFHFHGPDQAATAEAIRRGQWPE